MPRHEDVAKLVLVYRQWFPKLEIGIMKFDVARAFRQKLISAGAFGTFAFRLCGHTCVDQAFVFGHAAAPAVYAQTGRAIHEAHHACGMHFTGAELLEFGYEGYDELTPQEQLEGIEVPYLSVTYADDGVLVAPQIPRFVEATKESYTGFMKAALGSEAVSNKDLAEQQWSQKQIVIGHLFVLGAEADARGHRDFLMPTQARITLMMEVMSDVQFTPGKDCALRLSRCGYGCAFRVCDLKRSLGRSSGLWKVGSGAQQLTLSHQ